MTMEIMDEAWFRKLSELFSSMDIGAFGETFRLPVLETPSSDESKTFQDDVFVLEYELDSVFNERKEIEDFFCGNDEDATYSFTKDFLDSRGVEASDLDIYDLLPNFWKIFSSWLNRYLNETYLKISDVLGKEIFIYSVRSVLPMVQWYAHLQFDYLGTNTGSNFNNDCRNNSILILPRYFNLVVKRILELSSEELITIHNLVSILLPDSDFLQYLYEKELKRFDGYEFSTDSICKLPGIKHYVVCVEASLAGMENVSFDVAEAIFG